MSLIDWGADDPASTIPPDLWVPDHETIVQLWNAALDGIAHLKKSVDYTGVGQATGIVSFYTLDQKVAELQGQWDAETTDVERFVLADHLAYVFERAQAAYNDPRFTVPGAAGKAAKDAAGAVANIGAKAAEGVGIGAALVVGLLALYLATKAKG